MHACIPVGTRVQSDCHSEVLSTLLFEAEFHIGSEQVLVSTRAPSGTGAMAQPLSAPAALAEDLSLASSIYVRWPITACN